MTARTLMEQQSAIFDIHRLARLAAEAVQGSFERMVHVWRNQRDREHLHAVPDSLLKDIGISRSQIDQAVMFGRQVSDRRGYME